MQPDNRLATVLTTVSGSTCTVSIDGVATVVEVLRGVTVAVDDVVLIHRVGAAWFVSGRRGASTPAPPPPDPDPVPPPKPSVVTGQLVVPPVETRSYRPSGWRSDNTDVYQGEYGGWGNHVGCAFYGSKPRSLAGATVTSATVKFQRPANTGGSWGASSTTLWLLSQATRPSGAPTRNESTAGPSIASGRSTTFTIPDSWAQAMVNGTRGGIAVYEADGSPYVIFAGRSRWGGAMVLTINWRR